MEVPAQPPPFLLARGHQPLPGALQLLRQQHRMQRHRHRSGQDLEDPPVGHPERPLSSPQPDQQHADLLALVLQGDRLGGGAGLTERGHLHVGDAEAGRWQPQGLAHRLQHPGEDVPVGRAARSVPETLAEPDHGLHRVMPFAVEQPVDPALQPVPGRREPDSDDRGCHQAAPQPDPLLQQPLGELDHRDVHGHATGGQQPIHHRAVDQPVDVVQAVAQDRDPDGDVERPRGGCRDDGSEQADQVPPELE